MKIDLHIHTKEDSVDEDLDYSMKDVIDKAKEKGIEVIAFTFHDRYFSNKKISDYAKKKEILIIPGVEKTIEGKHVLIYNCKTDVSKINTFKDLKELRKQKNVLIGAPHPFFKDGTCLGRKIVKYLYLFDFVEYCWFHTKLINFNKKAVKISKKYNIPLLATTDLHHLKHFGNYYTEVSCKKTISSVINTIKKGKINRIVSPNVSYKEIFRISWEVLCLRFN